MDEGDRPTYRARGSPPMRYCAPRGEFTAILKRNWGSVRGEWQLQDGHSGTSLCVLTHHSLLTNTPWFP